MIPEEKWPGIFFSSLCAELWLPTQDHLTLSLSHALCRVFFKEWLQPARFIYDQNKTKLAMILKLKFVLAACSV